MNELDIFSDAIELADVAARSRFLDEACDGRPELRQRIEALLRNAARANQFLESPAPGITATIDHLPPELPGTQIGPYKLLEQIGEGGMGIVYVASQKEPLRRKVALKIIKPGMDTREVVARFEAERQALALMDHPNIAKVFDGGVTNAGRPYFAMELVRGKPITEYCDHEQLSTRERLTLFVAVCQGVQHAHQKGIIHRDLKPSNILIKVYDVRAVPVVIDFGIAKAVGQQLSEQSLHTAFDQMVGTPLYMSPEQAGQSAVDVDTRSDIYSLGVLLYELLTGHTPFEKDTFRTAGVDEMRRVIREVDPPRPSARVTTLQAADLSTIAGHRHVDPRKLSQQLRGDLDWIVMKALDKDRTRRYPSASALAADMQRFLDDEPVQARPPSLAHHAAKWVRRHRPLVWSTAVVLVITALASGALSWTSYRRAAQLERDVGEHLVAATGFFSSGDYHSADRKLAEARGCLNAAGYRAGPLDEQVTALTAAIAAKNKAAESYVQFEKLRHRIHSEMYAVDRDILDQAQQHCREALRLLGVLDADLSKSQAGYQNLNPERQLLLEEGAVELLFIGARLAMDQCAAQAEGQRAAAYLEAVEALRKVETIRPRISAVSLWMADCWESMGEQQAAAEARARADSLHPASATDHYLCGEYHARHGRHDQALASYWQALAQQPNHYLSLLAAGVSLGALKEYKSAEAMLTGAIAMYPQTTLGYVKRGASRLGQGNILLAQADFQEAVKLDPELAAALIRRACDFHENLELDKALADLDEAIRLDPKSAWAYAQRSLVYVTRGDMDKVIADCNAAIQLDAKYSLAYACRAAAYRGKGELDKALADSNEAIRIDPNFSGGYFERGVEYTAKGELDKALADLNEALRLDPTIASAPLHARAEVYRCRGEYDKALADCDEAIRLSPKAIWAYLVRAAVHEAKGDVEKALAECSQAIGLNRDIPWGYRQRGRTLQARGDLDKALADYSEAIRLGPTAAGAYVERGGAYAAKGDSDKALADYNEAIRLAPSLASPYVGRAGIHITKRDVDKALVDLDEAIRLDPKSAWAYGQRSLVYVARGDLDKVIADSNAAIQLDAKNSLAYVCRAAAYRDKGEVDKALADSNEAIQLNPKFAWAYAERSTAYAAKGDSDKAMADYDEAIRLEPRNGDWYGRRGTLYLDLCEFEKAAADLDRAAELAPISWHFYKLRAVAHFQLQHYDKALESIAKAVELNPGDTSNLLWISPARVAKCPDDQLRQGLLELADKALGNSQEKAGAYAAHGILRHAFGRQEEALVDFDKAIELEPRNPGLWVRRASFHVDQGQGEKALADFAKALELQPDTAGTCNNLAWYLATCSDPRVRQPDRAVELATKATQLAPNDGNSWNTLGVAQYRAGDYKATIDALTKSMERGSGGTAIDWFFLAMAHGQLGNQEEARQWYDKAVAWMDENQPDDEELLSFRAEAAELLGITAEKTKEAAPNSGELPGTGSKGASEAANGKSDSPPP